MENTLVIGLHGFLGQPEDWERWQQQLPSGTSFWAVNLWKDPDLNSSLSLSAWTEAFIQAAKYKKSLGYRLEVWGYSMGGRLALGALLAEPNLFARAMILSANPGLEQPSERNSRRERDHRWAEKFRHQEWSSLMEEWHSQPVLREPGGSNPSTSAETLRRAQDFDRERLAQSLEHWSLSEQPNYWPRLPSLQNTIDWHVGELDSVYLGIGKRVKELCPEVQLHIHPGRGHRLIL